MTSTAAAKTVNPEREAYIQAKMAEFARREASLQGRKVNYFNDQDKENAYWWGGCRLYTMIAVFALLVIAAIAMCIVAGLGLII